MTRRPRRNVSGSRKAIYYAGNIVFGIGFLLFMSVFVGVLCIMASPPEFGDMGSAAAWTFGRGFVGFAMIIAGRLMAHAGKQGLAGSGIILDPEQAREDMEPWSRMAGGMTNDTLEEIEPLQKIANGFGAMADGDHSSREVVKVRCRSCRTLNDEDARFCDQCGQAM